MIPLFDCLIGFVRYILPYKWRCVTQKLYIFSHINFSVC